MRLKLWLKRTLGTLASLANPRLTRAVLTADPAALSTRLGQLILFSKTQQAATNGAWGSLRQNLTHYWKTTPGDHFYTAYAHRFEDWFLKDHYPLITALIARATAGPYHTLTEVGCGDGRVLHHLSEKLPQLTQLTGLDLNPRIIAQNQTTYTAHPRLHFAATDAADYLLQRSEERRVGKEC